MNGNYNKWKTPYIASKNIFCIINPTFTDTIHRFISYLANFMQAFTVNKDLFFLVGHAYSTNQIVWHYLLIEFFPINQIILFETKNSFIKTYNQKFNNAFDKLVFKLTMVKVRMLKYSLWNTIWILNHRYESMLNFVPYRTCLFNLLHCNCNHSIISLLLCYELNLIYLRKRLNRHDKSLVGYASNVKCLFRFEEFVKKCFEDNY